MSNLVFDESSANREASHGYAWWFSGDTFGVGDIAVAPFVWNLTNMGLSWTPRPHLERWIQQLSERPAYRNVVMIPVT